MNVLCLVVRALCIKKTCVAVYSGVGPCRMRERSQKLLMTKMHGFTKIKFEYIIYIKIKLNYAPQLCAVLILGGH